MTDTQARLVLGQNIRKARKAAGLTQQVAAVRAGTRQGSLSEIELGKRGVSVGMLTHIASALNTTISQLTEGL